MKEAEASLEAARATVKVREATLRQLRQQVKAAGGPRKWPA